MKETKILLKMPRRKRRRKIFRRLAVKTSADIMERLVDVYLLAMEMYFKPVVNIAVGFCFL